MVDGAEYWISWKHPAFLSKFSCLQVIQNSAPSTIVCHQCDIQISLSYILFGNSIPFQIIAKDMNGSAGYLSSDALIELTIIDVNDETPTVNTMNTGSVSCVKSP